MKRILLRNILTTVAICCALAACNSDKHSGDTDLIKNPASTKPLTHEDSVNMPIIAFDTLAHNFGDIKEGDVPAFEFVFTNKGKSNLLISSVSATCGCTTPYWPKEIIKPGASDKIKVTYDSKGREGQFRKGVIVTANTYPSVTRLTISGTVIPEK